MEPEQIVSVELRNGETVLLSRFELEHSGPAVADIARVLHGEASWFPPFDVPLYEGEQGIVEVEPGGYENRGYHGGAAEARLYYFAYLVRPFGWSEDHRRDYLQDLVVRSTSAEGSGALAEASTQDLWDALFTYVRGERFFDGLIAIHAKELTTVANEIRERLVEEPARSDPESA